MESKLVEVPLPQREGGRRKRKREHVEESTSYLIVGKNTLNKSCIYVLILLHYYF